METTISGYLIDKQLYESNNSLVYRGRQVETDQPVILKMLKDAYPSPEKMAWFRREFELTHALTLDGTVDAYSLETAQQHLVIVMEDFGGESLERLTATRRFSLETVLSLILQITGILGQLHQQHIIHKDINPANIVFNPKTGQLKLIDFGISSALSQENPTPRNPDLLEGTLAYLSPEQTGRMNRALDYRTDFYSLGVTLYELLTGQQPYAAPDAMALVHAHIAKEPTPPHVLDPDIPEPLSGIVMRLMAKNAEDRYQSAFGLKTDLEECLRQYQATGWIEPFALGRHDASDRFQIPQKLYGRDAETALLLEAFDRISQGAGEMMVVSGYAGVGKTALVQEIYKPVTRQRGYFIAGKFDQFQRNIPYAALTQAFGLLLRQVLAEDEEHVAVWRQKLLAALGPNGRVMSDVIPEVELVVGPQPEAPVLAPAEAQNRFNLVFQAFARVFAQPDHPLILFLDDLQWADLASLNLLQHLMTAPDNAHLFVIGAYRDNEVSEAHPLMTTLEEIRNAGSVLHHVVLAPLERPDVNLLIAETLRSTPQQTGPLADLVVSKTNGNPFFVNEFLKSLYSEALLHFDARQRAWRWDLTQIQAQEMTDNVVVLMAGKVQKLGDQPQQVLKRAACIGNPFDLKTLAIVHEKTPGETAAGLREALAEGLVVPLSDTYKLMELDVEDLTDEVTVLYRFAHDRIQQAVYSLIPEEDKQAVHWRVGRLLLRNTPREEREQKIFDIVNQLNRGLNGILSQEERDELIALNLAAGKRAKAAAAYEPAFNYLDAGARLLGEESWQRRYDLTLEVYGEAAEAAYLIGDFEQTEQWVQLVVEHAHTLVEKAKAYEVKFRAYLAQARILEALQVGLNLLKLLGVSFPDNPDQEDVRLALKETQDALAGKSMEDLVALPEMTDPDKQMAMRFLYMVATFTYSFPELYSLIVFRMVRLSAQHGHTLQAPGAYAGYGLILCGRVGDLEAGYLYGNLALSLVQRFKARVLQPTIGYLHELFIRHWKEPYKASLPSLLEAYRIGVETGELVFAASSLSGYACLSFYSGRELTETEQELQTYWEALDRIKQRHAVHRFGLYWQTVLNLMGRSEDPCLLIGEGYDEAAMLPILRQAKNLPVFVGVTYVIKLSLCFRFQAYDEALDNAVLAEQYIDHLGGLPESPTFFFYEALARLARFPDSPQADQEDTLRRVAVTLEKLKTWAHHAPMNYRHQALLVEAERARVLGRDSQARAYYDQAIDLAHVHEYVQDEALANELAAQFYLASGQPRIAGHYLQDAHYAYLKWGAQAKVKDLEARYPQFLDLAVPARSPYASTVHTATHTSSALDLDSVLKATQAISGEIVLEKLLTTLMKIVIENAGAQLGYLLLEKKGQWVIEAEGAVDSTTVTVLQSLPVETSPQGSPRLPLTLINYVVRTQESVVLDEATEPGPFSRDPYIVTRRPTSVLCSPLLNQGKLTGLLYLENNLTPGAFTPDRLEVLNLLSSQAAISIENARLFAHQVHLTNAASRFVPYEFLRFLGKENMTEIGLGDQVQQEMAILVSDIRAFTTLSETMTPQENFDFVNAYLERVSPVVRQHQGLIVKYIGDGMMAVFPERVDDALEAAVEQLKQVALFNAARQQHGQVPIRVGTGIHTGNMMLGTVGETERMQLDLLSDAVNLASRLEGLTRLYSASIIVSEATFLRLAAPDHFKIRFLGKAQVKGRQKTVSVFEVFDGEPPARLDRKLTTKPAFEDGLARYYERRFREACVCFNDVLRRDPEDKAAQLYLTRAAQYMVEGVPAAWEGVEVLKEK